MTLVLPFPSLRHSADGVIPPCDVEPLALPEPFTQCLLSRPPDHVLIGTRIADHLPQRSTWC